MLPLSSAQYILSRAGMAHICLHIAQLPVSNGARNSFVHQPAWHCLYCAGCIDVIDSSTGQLIHHTVILSSVAADSPAAAKVLKHMGHAAKLACPSCTLHGQQDPAPGKRGMFFIGYDGPTTASKPNLMTLQAVALDSVSIRCRSHCRWHTHAAD